MYTCIHIDTRIFIYKDIHIYKDIDICTHKTKKRK